jgi:hypothetical protein
LEFDMLAFASVEKLIQLSVGTTDWTFGKEFFPHVYQN